MYYDYINVLTREIVMNKVESITKYLNMLKGNDSYTKFMSVFMVYCQNNNIKFTFPFIMGDIINDNMSNEEIKIFNAEAELFNQCRQNPDDIDVIVGSYMLGDLRGNNRGMIRVTRGGM